MTEQDNRILEFYEDSRKLDPKECLGIGIEPDDITLKELGDIYSSADTLSIRNARAYRRTLALLSVAATLVTLAFLLYDEAELHWMIILCGILILGLFLINRIAGKLNCFRKYMEYRVLAESARVQIFTHYAGTDIKVADILPWPLQMNVPWIVELLKDKMKNAVSGKKHPIRECWIEDQRSYHLRALKKTQAQAKMNDRIVRVSLVLSIAFYLFALFFEIRYAGLLNGRGVIAEESAEFTRTILKILLGGMSAATLFTGNYFGKLALPNNADDHKRMIALYDLAKKRIDSEGEKEELILDLAREELNENSSWYSYQSVNSPDISL